MVQSLKVRFTNNEYEKERKTMWLKTQHNGVWWDKYKIFKE